MQRKIGNYEKMKKKSGIKQTKERKYKKVIHF